MLSSEYITDLQEISEQEVKEYDELDEGPVYTNPNENPNSRLDRTVF